jgi:hypothetical protein
MVDCNGQTELSVYKEGRRQTACLVIGRLLVLHQVAACAGRGNPVQYLVTV